jgi:hypothetical protein
MVVGDPLLRPVLDDHWMARPPPCGASETVKVLDWVHVLENVGELLKTLHVSVPGGGAADALGATAILTPAIARPAAAIPATLFLIFIRRAPLPSRGVIRAPRPVT